MKIAKLFFPGIYEDAYVYMGRLFILTEQRTILVYDLDKLVNSLEQDSEKRVSGSLPIPTYMFSRNDWLSSSQFKSLLRNLGMYSSFLSAFEQFPQPYFEVDKKDFLLKEQELDISDPVILDTLIYNERLYMGATNGFYQIDITWDKKGPVTLGKTEKKIDARCLSTSARYGTVNASCNEEGLFTFVDDFGWWEQGKSSRMQTLANKSLKTSWIGLDIVNYSGYDHLDLFRSNSEKTQVKLEPEGRVLVGIDSNGQDLSYLFEAVQARYNIPTEKIQFTFNSSNRLFLHTDAGFLHSIQIHSENDIIQLGKAKVSKETTNRILSINSTKLGPVIETSDQVALVLDKNGQIFTLSESGALVVRTFPRSKRFQNMVAIVDDNGVFLVSLFDESEFEKKHFNALKYEEYPNLEEIEDFFR
ncbi:MAG TPA: hypothetical protein VN207_10450 [Ktedonobacteraceae bacterium]|nr:hypothetical protein [Ktedonobacteraceae bacterium]